MSEPFFRAVTPDGRTAVVIRVPEEEGAEMVFSCSVVIDEKTVIADMQTQDQSKMLAWAKKHMTEAMRRTA